MNSVKRLIIADAHLGQRPGDADVMLELLRRATDSDVSELVYLGDVCQYLIGMAKFWTGTVRALLEGWLAYRHSGGRVVLVEGNRDFFLDETDLAAFVDATCRSYEFIAGRRSFHLVHGDKVNARDLQYRFWATVSKSVIARLWARMLPQGMAVAIVEGMERRLAASNRKFRYELPVEDLERHALAMWEGGADVVLWGHFHQTWSWRKDGKVAMVVDDWLQTRSSLLVDDQGTMTAVDARLEALTDVIARRGGEQGGHR